MPQTFETRLSPDGSAVRAARIVPGTVLAYDPFTGMLLAWTGTDLIRFDPAAPPPAIACIVDAVDLSPVTSVAPGELVTLFGMHFANDTDVPAPGSYPRSMAGVTVDFNGVAGPLLYVSPKQINVQVPYEVVNHPEVSLAFASAQLNQSDSRTLPVTARNPVAFLDSTIPATSADCPVLGQDYADRAVPLAFNSDGSRNSCSNPAAPGSVVKLFLAGLGITDPSPVTGSINPSPGIPLNLPITVGNNLAATVVSATELPGSISGVWQVDIRTPTNQAGALAITLSVDSVPVRETKLAIWTR
jgi:uncharacterized protein (TIGR03437 family)